MKTIGIIAEYNPFHNGHEFQINEAKHISGAEYVVVILSGNYVQRGTPAILDKYSRTKMALLNGADLVFELPVSYATASAEAFAFGGVSLLNSLGFIDGISFGCETKHLSVLQEIASLFLEEPLFYQQQLSSFLKQGISFPAARSKAALAYFTSAKSNTLKELPISFEELQEILMHPNNILAIEYLKALKLLSSNITPVPILRKQSGYHSTDLSGTICSATALRNAYETERNLQAFTSFIPNSVFSILVEQEQKTFPIYADDFSSLLYYKLLQTTDFSPYNDISKDFGKRIQKTDKKEFHFTTFAEQLKSKDIVYSRVCRNLLHVLLDIKDMNYKKQPEYLRLLGFRRNASHLIKSGATSVFHPAVPVITKVADGKSKLSSRGVAMLEQDCMASHLYNHICYEKFGYIAKSEYEQGPVIL